MNELLTTNATLSIHTVQLFILIIGHDTQILTHLIFAQNILVCWKIVISTQHTNTYTHWKFAVLSTIYP